MQDEGHKVTTQQLQLSVLLHAPCTISATCACIAKKSVICHSKLRTHTRNSIQRSNQMGRDASKFAAASTARCAYLGERVMLHDGVGGDEEDGRLQQLQLLHTRLHQRPQHVDHVRRRRLKRRAATSHAAASFRAICQFRPASQGLNGACPNRPFHLNKAFRFIANERTCHWLLVLFSDRLALTIEMAWC